MNLKTQSRQSDTCSRLVICCHTSNARLAECRMLAREMLSKKERRTQATDVHLCVSKSLANLRTYTIVLFYVENVCDVKMDAFLLTLPMAMPPSVNVSIVLMRTVLPET